MKIIETNVMGLEWGPYSIKVEYEYKPSIRNLFATKSGEILLKKLEQNRSKYNSLIHNILMFKEKISQIPFNQTDDYNPFWNQGWFPSIDAIALYGLLAVYKPARYIEIGSGNSTKFARRSIIDNNLPTQIISIDPDPRAEIDTICDNVIRSKVENLSYNEILTYVKPGDILFIDNSHRSFQGSDVTVCFTEIIPSLPSGVIYGIHDIFIPFDYPPSFEDYFYNEQYLLECYLLGGAANDEIILPLWYITRLKELALPFHNVVNSILSGNVEKEGSAFWMKKG
jgi:hypothetical protein